MSLSRVEAAESAISVSLMALAERAEACVNSCFWSPFSAADTSLCSGETNVFMATSVGEEGGAD